MQYKTVHYYITCSQQMEDFSSPSWNSDLHPFHSPSLLYHQHHHTLRDHPLMGISISQPDMGISA